MVENRKKLTDEQLREIVRQVFNVIDTNNNGTLDEEELKTFLKDMEKKHANCPPFDDDKFSKNWNRMDKNKDKVIDFEELVQFMKEKAIADG